MTNKRAVELQNILDEFTPILGQLSWSISTGYASNHMNYSECAALGREVDSLFDAITTIRNQLNRFKSNN